jgi:hypothetical protein
LTPTERRCRPAISDARTWTDKPWRERPPHCARGCARARSAGSLTPGFVYCRSDKPGWWAAQSAARPVATPRVIVRVRSSSCLRRGRCSSGWTRCARASHRCGSGRPSSGRSSQRSSSTVRQIVRLMRRVAGSIQATPTSDERWQYWWVSCTNSTRP